MMKTVPASGVASAHRYSLASLTTIFKTRIEPCRIAVRADHENYDKLTENRRPLCCLRTPFVDTQSEVPMINRALLRFPEHWRLKTQHSQRRCGLLCPDGTGRRHSNGLLEQMP